jgi:hypothetical protein
VVLGRPDLDILTDLHVFGAPECEKVVFEMLYVCMCSSLVPEQLNFIHHRSLSGQSVSKIVIWRVKLM